MELSFAQFLEELKTTNGSMSVEAGVVTFENGATFDANTTMPVVVTQVSGGILDAVSADIPIRLISADYDVEGADELSKDPDGEECVLGDGLAIIDPDMVSAFVDAAESEQFAQQKELISDTLSSD